MTGGGDRTRRQRRPNCRQLDVDLGVAEAAAPDREIAVEVGENIVEVRNLTVKFGGLTRARRRDRSTSVAARSSG